MTEFAQLVIGPPGSGKTTYCAAMKSYFQEIKRAVILINLDFANDYIAKVRYRDKLSSDEADYCICLPDIDVRDFLKAETVMNERLLGPNGSILYCIKQLDDNFHWLTDKINAFKKQNGIQSCYYLIDCPGQIDVYLADSSIKQLLTRLSNKNRDMRFCVVNLLDCRFCSASDQFISGLLLTLSIQLQFEFPFVNLLTKSDLFEKFNKNFSIEYFSQAEDLDYFINDRNTHSYLGLDVEKRKQLLLVIANIIDDFNLTSLIPISVFDNESLAQSLSYIDKALGYLVIS